MSPRLETEPLKCATLSHRANHLLWIVRSYRGLPVTPMGSPPSSLEGLRRLSGRTDQFVRRGVAELRRAGMVRTERVGVHGAMRVSAIMSAPVALGIICIKCGNPTDKAGRWCPKCKQEERSDRAWQQEALELCKAGVPPLIIAAKLNRPEFVASADDGRETNGGAVVPFLLGQEMLGPEWAERLREAQRGAVDETP